MKSKAKKYFIQEFLLTDCHYGGIGCKDIEEILRRNGFQPIQFPFHAAFSLKAKFFRILFFCKCLFQLPSDAIIVFQTPMYAFLNRLLIKTILLFRKSIKLVCIITDIDGLRDNDETLLNREKKFFECFRYFIVHNNQMKDWLLKVKGSAAISTFELFDFLTLPNKLHRQKYPEVAFSGNTINSAFIYDLTKIKNVKFNLYGEVDAKIFFGASNIIIYGFVQPIPLKDQIKGSFGLVWNGDSINSLTNSAGTYLYINSPHKLSSYIVSGLPVIVHAASASAGVVKKYGRT